jgi:hypothetical protein
MIPIDYKESGQIRDDELFKALVCPMPKGGKGVSVGKVVVTIIESF